MGHIIWTAVVGLVIGAVAKLLMPGRDPGGCLITMAIGIAGAYLAAYAGPKLGWKPEGGIMVYAGPVIGAMVLLLLYRIIAPRRD
jgi:uncharacterized membrane protein YeaQ/YmgE (transglycosylase-associated protein family)